MAKLKDPKTWVLEEDTSEAPSSLSIGFIRITENNNLNKQELIDSVGDTVLTYDEQYLKDFFAGYSDDNIAKAFP